MRIPTLIPLAVLLLAAAACGESAARTAAREQARRNACVAGELALSAKERLASLDTQLVVVQGGPLERMTAAGRAFADAYKTYADAYSQSADLADSAAFARSQADSLRLAQQAQRVRPALLPEGTLLGNAGNRFNADMIAALDNPDHPCNKPKGEDGDS